MTNNTSAHQLIKELYSLDPIRQIVAISQIKDLDIKSAIPDLIKLLSSPEEDVRWLVVEALADITNFEDELTAKALAQMLFDSSSLVRCDTIYALSDLNYKLAREKIEDLLINDPDWLVRVAAAETLANLADKGNISSISKLADALNDPIQVVRSFSACTIGLIGIQDLTLIKKLDIHLKSEESLGTKAEIIGAKCRLGVEVDFLKIFDFLKVAEDEDCRRILNSINDLATRQIPICMISNSKYICAFLSEFSDSKLQFKCECEKIVYKIQSLTEH
jgi:HEAT repeat protein